MKICRLIIEELSLYSLVVEIKAYKSVIAKPSIRDDL